MQISQIKETDNDIQIIIYCIFFCFIKQLFKYKSSIFLSFVFFAKHKINNWNSPIGITHKA